MNNFIVVEVGSTVSKCYHYLNDEIIDLPSKNIMFKAHMKNGDLDNNDVDELYSLIKSLKKITTNVHVYGTSVFRKLTEQNKTKFLEDFKKNTKLNFNIVSSKQEALFTVSGVILNNNYSGRMAIMIGGGGSIEVAVVENKKIIEMHFNDFGAVNINQKFKDINNFNPEISEDELDEFCNENIEDIENKCDILVTAGGDPKYCQECMASEFLEKNKFYVDKNQPHMITVKNYLKADRKFIFKQDINIYENFTVYQDDWWNFARGYNYCIGAVAKKVGAKYEIPTKINMCLGIISELKLK